MEAITINLDGILIRLLLACDVSRNAINGIG